MPNDYLRLLEGGETLGATPPAANPYLDLMQADEDRQNVRMRASITQAATVNPDKAALSKRVAGYLGTTPAAVEALPADAERAAKLKEISDNTAAAPVLRQRYTDADWAKLAHDDSGTLSAVEAAVKYLVSAPGAPRGGLMADLGKTGGAVLSGANSFNEGAWGAARAGAELLPDVIGKPMADTFTRLAQQERNQAAALMPKAEGNFEAGWYSGLQSLGQNLVQLPAIIANPALGLGSMGVTTGGQAYGQARDQGVGQALSLLFGASQGVIEAGTEAIGLPAFMKLLKPGQFGAKAMGYLLKEQGGEQIATHLQDLNEWAVLPENKSKTFGDYLAARPDAAIQTAIATAVGGGGQVALVRAAQAVADRIDGGQRQAQQAEQRAQALGQLATLAEASKLRERDPENFAVFAQELTDQDVPRLYVDPRALQQAGVDLPALAQALPSIAPQLQTALATGGDVAVPTGEFLAQAPGQPWAAALIDHARTGETAMSAAEARTYMQDHGERIQAEIARTVEQHLHDTDWQAGRDAVRGEFQRQLDEVGRWQPEVNRQYAALLGDYYAATAARAGMTPQELAERYPLRIQAKAGQGAALEQSGDLVYHGTSGNHSDFSSFYAGSVSSGDGRGFWFTKDIGYAWEYAENAAAIRSGKPRVMRARLRYDRPLIVNVDDTGRVYAPGVSEKFENNSDVIDYALKHGHDAIEWVNGSFTDAPSTTVFSPDQIDIDQRELLENNIEILEKFKDETFSKVPSELANLGIEPPEVERYGNEGFDWKTSKYESDEIFEDRGDAFSAGLNYQIGMLIDEMREQLSSDGSVLSQPARGQIAFGKDITQAPSVISLFDGADFSTLIHEAGHFFLEAHMDLAGRIAGRIADGEQVSDGERGIVADANALLGWFGVAESPEASALSAWHAMTLDEKRAFHEQFARGFERYALDGKAPSLSLQSVFQRFGAWLKNVYRSITQRSADEVLQVHLTDEVRQVMDRMIATDEQIREAEAMREMGPLFGGAEQAGMGSEEWTRYHELAAQATAQAADQLQARGVRDMQWMRNAHSRELKRLQARAAGLRAEVEMEVRREVLSMPIYRAWQFLTTKGDAQATAQPTPRVKAAGALDNTRDNLFTAIAKLGGLDRSEVVGAWGVDPKDRLESGVFGAPVLRKDGGLSIDAMAERLVEEGYLLPDENGRADVADLETAFDSQRRGVDQFSTWHDYAERARAAQGEDAPEALPDEILHGKLNTEVLRDMYGTQPDALWRTLSTRRMTSEANGIHPEVVAETFGYDSGDALVRALVAADPPRQVIEGLTDQRMLERYGDLATPEGLQREADKAIHNEARARVIATELDALEKMGRVREPAGGRATADVLAKAARDYALAVIGAKKVRDIRPSEYTAAEARASKAAQKAFKAGDTQTAAAEKRNQLIQNAAARAAMQAREEVEKAVEYLRRMEKRPKGLDAGYADQIDQLLERFDLKAVSNKELDKRTGLAAWVESQREQGMEPDIAPELLNEAARTNWRNLTLDELRGLRDAVRQIEHLGRLKGKLLASKAKRDFEAVRDELADSIEANARGRTADTRTPATVLGRSLASIKRFGALHIKAATWARIFDGGKDGGPVWEYLIRGANAAGDFETARRAQATEALTKILAPVLKSTKLHRKAHYASIGRSLTREQVLGIALNTGNEGNWQRLLDGEGWTRPQVAGVLNTLTAAEWQAVQGVWDHMESYRPEIGAKEKRVYGKEPEWVEPVSFLVDTADGQRLTLRGGYFPIKYDPAANARTESHTDAEDAKRQMQGAYTSATTRRGFTKSRVNEVKGRPLMYSLSAVYNGVQDVIHDLAWHEWLIDTNKLLRSDKVDSAIRQHYGPEVVRQIKDWVKDNAAGDRPAQAGLDEALSRVRRGVSMAGLGFNVMSAAMQPLGITQSIVRVGAPWVARGVAQYVANPFKAARRVNEASAFMAGRSRTRFRELNEVRNQVDGQSGAMRWVNRNAYWLMMRCQQTVDVPTWLGAYEKAVADGADEERAVALADQAVIDAQGGGQVKDQAGVEKGGPSLKLFTVFYSFMNTALNLGVSQGMTADTPAKKAKLAADALLLYTVPAVLGAALKAAITPGDSGDWDDPEEIAKKLAAAQLDYLMGLFALVRETTEAVKTISGLGDKPRDYAGPAGLRLIPDFGAFAKQAAQGEFDDAFRKAAINLAGDLFGLPAAQANRTITGAKALADGETSNPAALVFGFQRPH